MILLILYISLSIIISYLIGSLPTAYLVGKYFKKIDIRQHGSGNVGATNALRVLGTKLGILVLLVDVFKGVLAIWVAHYMQRSLGEWFVVTAGLSAILGHMYTVFLGFKGGKGVATATGVCAAIMPLPFWTALFIFIVVVFLTKYVSLGSILAAIMLTIIKYIEFRFNGTDYYEYDLTHLIFAVVITVFIIYKHIPNIKRLFKGTENKISFKK